MNSSSGALEACKVRCRVIAAIVIREMTGRFGSKFGGYAWAIVEPATYIFMLSALFSTIGRAPPLGQSFLLFYASGFIAIQYYTSLVGQINNAIKSNRPLLNYPVVAPIDVIIGRFIMQTMTMALVGHIVIGFAVINSGEVTQIRYESLIPAALFGAFFATGVGMFNIVAFPKAPLYEQVFSVITRPMFLVSGVIFLPETIPPPFRDWVLWNPLTHVVLLFRTGIYPYYRAPYLDVSYLFESTMIALLIGTFVFTVSRSKRNPGS